MKTGARTRSKETWEFRLIFAVCFLMFLIGACFARLLPRRNRAGAAHPLGPKSIFGEAKLAASNSVPFAFM